KKLMVVPLLNHLSIFKDDKLVELALSLPIASRQSSMLTRLSSLKMKKLMVVPLLNHLSIFKDDKLVELALSLPIASRQSSMLTRLSS
ncbi:hypothetical protein, partial [Streptococcus gordonii]|uniref:hypothetical protein n=1 Tax=Streptococcus gordonii TaxID=1302 RepID=UPI0023B0D9E5